MASALRVGILADGMGDSMFGGSDLVDVSHLQGPASKVTPYWLEQLQRVDRREARKLVQLLKPENNLGYTKMDGTDEFGKGSLLEFSIQQRELHQDKVILLRVGEFYEAHGIDAVMLVAYCGLNPMGGRARAGCPRGNVQETCDGLTRVGLSVAVYEEIAEPDSRPGPAARTPKRKERALSAIVSPASCTYPYELCLRTGDMTYRANRPYVAVMGTTSGFSVYEFRLDEKCVVQSSRLTFEGVQATIASTGFVGPIFTQSAEEVKRLGFCKALSEYTEEGFVSVVQGLICDQSGVSVDDLRSFRRISQQSSGGRPRCVYKMTQLQIGLLPNPNVPDLVSEVVTSRAPAYSARFLRKWLANPPPQEMADQMQRLCLALRDGDARLPTNCVPYQVGQIISLLGARQCYVAVFKDLLRCAGAVRYMLERDDEYAALNGPLLALTSFEAGVTAEQQQLRKSCDDIVRAIEDVIAPEDNDDGPSFSSYPTLDSFPFLFLQENEKTFRGRVRRDHPSLEGLYDQVAAAAGKVLAAMAREYPLSLREAGFKYDIANNLVYLSAHPSAEGRPGVEYVNPTDRKGAKIGNRWTTKNVESALREYTALAAEAPQRVERLLKYLCDRLLPLQMAIVQASNFAMVLQAANAHTAASKQRGWCLPSMLTEGPMELNGLTAYWMPRNSPDTIRNSVTLDGIFLLTAPNMSGKSTLMRSVLVAALLANAGLFVPCERARVPRFDSFFLRTASYDVPKEGKSSYHLEMEDMKVVLRDCTPLSLVMVDEIGKGTSSKDGTAMAGAILEELDRREVMGIFATHLHELFQLPLETRTVSNKCMSFEENPAAEPRKRIKWTYKLQDGTSTDSHAISSARTIGIADSVCDRAVELAATFDRICRAPVQAALEPTTRPAKKEGRATRNASPSRDYDISNPGSELRSELVRVIGASFSAPLYVDHAFDPPASAEGHPSLYVLLVQESAQSTQFLYVGETDSIATRLRDHRSSTFPRHKISALVVKAPNKTAAREAETLVIRAFKKAGYLVPFDSDGNHASKSGS